MTALAFLSAVSCGFTHGVFSYSDVEKKLELPPWRQTAPLVNVRRAHQVIQARKILNDAAAQKNAHTFSVFQADGAEYNLHLFEYDDVEQVATLRTCLWHKDEDRRHVALLALRGWFNATTNNEWVLKFDVANTADKLEWAWGHSS